MAIDTREKRQAASVIGTVFPVGVTPNVSPDQEWRQEAAWSYPGILAGEPTTIVTIPRGLVFTAPATVFVQSTPPVFAVKGD